MNIVSRVPSQQPNLGIIAQQRNSAQLVADKILELRNMAKALKLYSITGTLEQAYYEAFSVANRPAPAAEADYDQ